VSETSSTDASPPWLDDNRPHDEITSAAQIASVLALLGESPKRVLDLGCGAGRVLIPLAVAGHDVTGLDHNATALRRCREDLERSGVEARLFGSDFARPESIPSGPFDAALCLGNTFMQIVDVDAAVDLMTRIAALLVPGGPFLLDDLPADQWPELTEGNWTSGISEDGRMQLVWHPCDAVFALRSGDAVDPAGWRIKRADAMFRMWTDGALRAAARAAGLSGPERPVAASVLVMRRPQA
jgi:SAM-dependent methyltransferase